MSEVLSEMKAEPAPAEEPQSEEAHAAPATLPPIVEEPKPKPKRKPRAKKEAVQEALPVVVQETPPPPTPSPEPEEPPEAKPPAAVPKEKVKCPDCGKMVSDKTLKYTHVKTCKARNPKHIVIGENEDLGPPDVDDQESTTEHDKKYKQSDPVLEEMLDKIVEEEIQKRTLNARQAKVTQRQQKFAKLTESAF